RRVSPQYRPALPDPVLLGRSLKRFCRISAPTRLPAIFRVQGVHAAISLHRLRKPRTHVTSIGFIMNTSYLCILSILFGIAGAASAQGPVNYPEEPVFVSTRTHAEVAADFLEARPLGLTTNNDIEIVI